MRRSLATLTAALALALALTMAASTAAAGPPAGYGGCDPTAVERVIAATPATYLALVPTLGPGDLLELAPGTYGGGLPLHDLAGEPGRCIVVAGPASGPPAVFTGRDCCNTVSIADASHLVVRDLVLDGQGRQGDAVKAEGTAAFAHHITLEGLTIRGHDAGQQIVGISTKCPAWSWVVRGNVVEGAGTGLYLGDSNGEAEFVHGLIEHNLVRDTLGYNLQVKHQNGRDTGLGIPSSGTTIIRHNVFSKAQGAAGGGSARPNLLLGHWPLAGAGSDDDYLVYGNLFWQNPTEALIQAEGNVILYSNLLVNDSGPAIHLQPHNDVPRRIRVFHNTVVASGVGIQVVGGDPGYEQRLAGNAVFAGTPLSGGLLVDNTTDTYASAAGYLNAPAAPIGAGLDLYPLAGALAGPPVDQTNLGGWPDADRDFDGLPRDPAFRGAYSGEGTHPGWPLALAIKPPPGLLFADGFESGDLSGWSASSSAP